MPDKFAIKVNNISKTFKIPHQKKDDTLKGAFVNLFKNLKINKKYSYEKFQALKNVSFKVKKGEFFGIIGKNGSGKSTLLKILTQIYIPDKGNIKINGEISPFLELGVGFNHELSGRENIYLNGSILGMSEKEIDKKFDSIVNFTEKEKFIDQKLKNYSSGMLVRLAFSIAIHANKDILIMDEVLAVGDSNFQSKCIDEFNKYKDQGKTIILVTHDTKVIQDYCDRALLLRNGKVVDYGKARKVVDKYLRQNMTDYEKRIEKQKIEEQKIKKKMQLKFDKEKKKEKIKIQKLQKSGKIVNVKVLNKESQEKNVFITGEEIKIKVNFKKGKTIKDFNIGIGLYKDDESYVFGYNTQMDNYKVDENSNKVVMHIKNNPLLSGTYSVNVVCFGKSEKSYYDLKLKAKTFKIFTFNKLSNYRGVVNIEHNWK